MNTKLQNPLTTLTAVEAEIDLERKAAGHSPSGRLLAVAATKAEDLRAWLEYASRKMYESEQG